MKPQIFVVATAVIGWTPIAFAETNHQPGMDHAAHMQMQRPPDRTLTEPGQGAFAALSEAVRVLEADPNTDWTKVDLAGLRAHLLDMDRLVTDTAGTETMLSDGILAVATGDDATIATLRRMVPAHAAQLGRDDRWRVLATETDTGAELRVTSSDPAVVARIKGLGFFGLMASQDHHRGHHMMMARGEDAHAH